MAKSIVISKIRCTSPNLKSTPNRNRNHLVYIATRDGVDLTPISNDVNLKDDDPAIYLKYIRERPRSHGLFGNLSDNDLSSLSQHIYQLSKRQTIFKGITSLSEEDAIRLQYCDKKSWFTMLKAAMPEIAKELGIPISKMAWVAAFHQEPGHPHVHYLLWSTDFGKIQNPFISTHTQNQCRQIFSKYIYGLDREMAIAAKTAARDAMIQLSKDLLDSLENVSEPNDAIIHISHDELNNMNDSLYKLRNLLPQSGRLNYKFLPPEIKHEVDLVVDKILKFPAFENQYHNYLHSVSQINASYSVVKSKAQHNLKSADDDLKKRIANIILKHMKLTPDPKEDLKKEPFGTSSSLQTSQTEKIEGNDNSKIFTFNSYCLLKNVFNSLVISNNKAHNTLNYKKTQSKKLSKELRRRNLVHSFLD